MNNGESKHIRATKSQIAHFLSEIKKLRKLEEVRKIFGKTEIPVSEEVYNSQTIRYNDVEKAEFLYPDENEVFVSF